MARTRNMDARVEIERLEKKHSLLKQQIAALDRQLFLTTQDQLRVTMLKKQRLAAKDALTGLRGLP